MPIRKPYKNSVTTSFYNREDVALIARELLGKLLVTRFNGELCCGRIVETEAYIAFTDQASHARNGRRTARNEHMYADAGTSYVYICYGIHPMFNVVTNKKNIPDAILIRALEPVDGLPVMYKRTGKAMGDPSITKGPGNLARAMGFSKDHSGLPIGNQGIYILSDKSYQLVDAQIGSSRRIGVESAGESAQWPLRFYVRGNKFVSGSPVR